MNVKNLKEKTMSHPLARASFAFASSFIIHHSAFIQAGQRLAAAIG